MSTHNIGFYEDLTKIIFELSSNMHLISSAENVAVRVMHQSFVSTAPPTYGDSRGIAGLDKNYL